MYLSKDFFFRPLEKDFKNILTIFLISPAFEKLPFGEK